MPKIRSKVRRGGLKPGEIYEMTANQCAALVAEGVATYVETPNQAIEAKPPPPPPPPLTLRIDDPLADDEDD